MSKVIVDCMVHFTSTKPEGEFEVTMHHEVEEETLEDENLLAFRIGAAFALSEIVDKYKLQEITHFELKGD